MELVIIILGIVAWNLKAGCYDYKNIKKLDDIHGELKSGTMPV